MPLTIRQLTMSDWDAIKSIYLEGIKTKNATFQTEAPTCEAWFASHVPECTIGCFEDEKLQGFATLNKISTRAVYAGVAEVSVYVASNARGKGVGQFLMESLIELSESQGYWMLQSGIFPENTASLKLHYKNGFREVGRRERIGNMDGKWRDTLLLERRSQKVGV